MNGRSRILADAILLLLLSLLLSCWLGAGLRTASASGTYTMTEAELQALEIRLDKLNQISETQQAESKRLKDTLTKSQAELNLLKSQLNISTAQLQQAQESLQNANKSLQEFATEEKRKRLKIKAQRNFWIGATITAILFAVVHR